MTDRNPPRGIALCCSLNGDVEDILLDEFSMSADLKKGVSLKEMFDTASVEKCNIFITEICDRGAAIDWELNLIVNNRPQTVSFAGARSGDRIFIIGARSSSDIYNLYDELLRINNDQVNLLRNAFKEKISIGKTEESPGKGKNYDDLSRLNSELLNLQREMAKKNQQLEKLNREKNTYLGMVSHDLRGLLVTITGFASMLEETAAGALDSEQMRFVKIIHSAGDRTMMMVNNLLDFSAIENGRFSLSYGIHSLNEIISKKIDMYEIEMIRKKIEIAVNIDGDITCSIDAERIEQVIDNLLSNAIKYSPHESRVIVSARKHEGCVEVSFKDSGPGISEKDREKLFGAYQRLDAKPTGGERSTGLGLAIAWRIIDAHGGKLDVCSRPGEGSNFFFTIPLD